MAEPYCDATLPVESRLKDLLSRMTLEEKIDCISTHSCSLSRLAIGMTWAEALHGLRFELSSRFSVAVYRLTGVHIGTIA